MKAQPDPSETLRFSVRILLLLSGLLAFVSCEKKSGIDFFTPYNYGFQIELEANRDGSVAVKNQRKHYVAGKYTPEQGMVMADQKTVYFTDDGDYRGFFMFIADKPTALDSGRLYMARWSGITGFDADPITGDGTGGAGELSWVFLGHGTDEIIEDFIKRDLKFTDFFDVRNRANCPVEEGFRLITAGDPGTMCLRLRDGTGRSERSSAFSSIEEFRIAVAFLETRKYGVWLGATSEFHKEEGMAYDGKNRLFVSMSSVLSSMEDNGPEKEAQNHMQLAPNRCGAVYSVALEKNRKDTDERPIPGDFVATRMESVLWGDWQDHSGNCSYETVSNPDNLRFLNGGLLLIGEDSHYHTSNLIWAFDTNRRYDPSRPHLSLSRVLSVPPGAETTGTMEPWYDPEHRLYYIFINAQHPHEFFEGAPPEEKRGISGALVVSDVSSDNLKGARFSSLPVPDGSDRWDRIQTSPSLQLNGETKELKYQIIFKSGDRDDAGRQVGLLLNRKGDPVREKTGEPKISNRQDGISLFVRDSGPVMITHFEESPGAVYATRLIQEKNGTLKPRQHNAIDFSPVGGTMINCASTRTPWDTHLSSEEDYYFDSFFFDPATVAFSPEHVDFCEKGRDGKYTGNYLAEVRGGVSSFWCTVLSGMVNDYWMEP